VTAAELVERLRRAVSLEGAVYDEIAAEPEATGQALLTVFAAALLLGLGRMPGEGLVGLLSGVMGVCLVWALWVAAVFGLARAIGERTELGPLFRALGLAAMPFGIGLLERLPWLGGLFWLVKWAFLLASFSVATARVLRVETTRAAILCAIGLVAALLVASPLRALAP
jgi:hypothetical protein